MQEIIHALKNLPGNTGLLSYIKAELEHGSPENVVKGLYEQSQDHAETIELAIGYKLLSKIIALHHG